MPITFETNRLEAFSDGVIAVVITIMVLELKVPHETGAAGLRAVLPTIAVYGLSFLLVGIYWVNHHELIGRLKRSNNRILWANLLWLFVLSLTPFFTAWVLEHKLDASSVQIYSFCQLLAGASFLVLRYAVDCQMESEGRTTHLTLATRAKHWTSIGVYIMAVLLAARMPRVALLLTGVVALLWIVPTLVVREETSGVHPPEHARRPPSALHSTSE